MYKEKKKSVNKKLTPMEKRSSFLNKSYHTISD